MVYGGNHKGERGQKVPWLFRFCRYPPAAVIYTLPHTGFRGLIKLYGCLRRVLVKLIGNRF